MRSTISVFLLLFPLLFGSVSAWAVVGRILSFEGDVQINGQQVTSDSVLNLDDTVATGPDASVQIVLSDNSVLDLDGNSQIDINDYSFNASESEKNTSQISVLAGTLRYVSGKIAKDDPTNVSFTAGTSTIGVRGTYISISICGNEVCD